MATILFGIDDSISHYNATYKLARGLKRQGHRVVYVSAEEERRADVTAQGLEFCRLSDEPGAPEAAQPADDTRRPGLLTRLRQWPREVRERYEAQLDDTSLDGLVADLRPDLIVLDIFHSHFVVTLHKYRIPVLILQTYLPLDKDKLIPPCYSRLIPRNTFWSNLRIEAAWLRYFLGRDLVTWRDKVLQLGYDYGSAQQEIARRNNFPLREVLDDRRTYCWGYKNVTELVFGASEFDFPRAPRLNRHYVGPMVDLERVDAGDPGCGDVMEACRQSGKPLVYCSLGTLSGWSKHSKAFFGKLIEAFREKEEFNLVLALSRNIDRETFTDVPPNVHIFQHVPQIEVLRHAALMITHGGYNSVTECILLGVPMLVYPLNPISDQNGNAARVAFHQLGIRREITRATPASISRDVIRVLDNPDYAANVRKMRQVYLQYDDISYPLRVVEELLPRPGVRRTVPIRVASAAAR